MKRRHQWAKSGIEPSLDALPRRSFRGGARWPIDCAALAALIDLGLSNAEIGTYFSVGSDDVHILRDQYGFDRQEGGMEHEVPCEAPAEPIEPYLHELPKVMEGQ